MTPDERLDALESTLTYVVEGTWWKVTPPASVVEGVRAELEALRSLRAERDALVRFCVTRGPDGLWEFAAGWTGGVGYKTRSDAVAALLLRAAGPGGRG